MKKYIIILPLFFLACGMHAQMKTESIFVYFKTNKSDLGKIGKHKLDSICKMFIELKITDIDIYGHTDFRGPDNVNNELSEKRVITVTNYIVSKGIDIKYIEQKKGFGKKSPKYDNNTVMGRRLNRRVEIAYKYEDKGVKKGMKDSVIDEVTVIVPPRAKDTVIVGPKGIVIMMKDCAFAPIDYKDVKWEFSEYFDQESIQASGIRTISNEGNCLVSGGMAFITATYQGREIQPKCPIDIAFPAKKLDTEMKLYDADPTVPATSTAWTLGSTALIFDSVGETAKKLPIKYTPAKNYYAFSTTSLGGKNCDKLSGTYTTSDSKAKLVYKKGNVFKIPKSDKNGITVSISDGMHNITAQKLSSRRFFFSQHCLVVSKVTATYYKNGVKMTCTREVGKIKYVKWRRMYKFKKKWFVPSK